MKNHRLTIAMRFTPIVMALAAMAAEAAPVRRHPCISRPDYLITAIAYRRSPASPTGKSLYALATAIDASAPSSMWWWKWAPSMDELLPKAYEPAPMLGFDVLWANWEPGVSSPVIMISACAPNVAPGSAHCANLTIY